MPDSSNFNYWMDLALEEAKRAYNEDEIPVGGLLARGAEIVALEHNRTRQLNDPTAHTEKLLVEKLISTGEKYLYEYTIVVTLEPCYMCAGLLVLSRIGGIVFGAYEPKFGAVGSIYNIPEDRQINHNPKVIGGIRNLECAQLIRSYFENKR